MLGKHRCTQNMEISTRSNDLFGKGYIFLWFCSCMGIPSVFPDFGFTNFSTNCLSSDCCRFFHDIKNFSLFPVYEFCLPIEQG